MNQENFTSLELSKWLAENGCELESDYYWFREQEFDLQKNVFIGFNEKFNLIKFSRKTLSGYPFPTQFYPAYDILNDICVRYAKGFFGLTGKGSFVKQVFHHIRHGQKKLAEDYIKEHCLFNPKNGEGK